jgi:hypothetical protein
MPSRIHTSCPVCRRPFVIVWNRENAAHVPMTISCPRLTDGVPCRGTVEATLPADAHAVAPPEKRPP